MVAGRAAKENCHPVSPACSEREPNRIYWYEVRHFLRRQQGTLGFTHNFLYPVVLKNLEQVYAHTDCIWSGKMTCSTSCFVLSLPALMQQRGDGDHARLERDLGTDLRLPCSPVASGTLWPGTRTVRATAHGALLLQTQQRKCDRLRPTRNAAMLKHGDNATLYALSSSVL